MTNPYTLTDTTIHSTHSSHKTRVSMTVSGCHLTDEDCVEHSASGCFQKIHQPNYTNHLSLTTTSHISCMSIGIKIIATCKICFERKCDSPGAMTSIRIDVLRFTLSHNCPTCQGLQLFLTAAAFPASTLTPEMYWCVMHKMPNQPTKNPISALVDF